MSVANKDGVNVTVNNPAVTLLKPRRSLRGFIFGDRRAERKEILTLTLTLTHSFESANNLI